MKVRTGVAGRFLDPTPGQLAHNRIRPPSHLVETVSFAAPYRLACARCDCGELVLPAPRRAFYSIDSALADAFAAHRRAMGCSSSDVGFRTFFDPPVRVKVVHHRIDHGLARAALA
jgi:hypothetical protein